MSRKREDRLFYGLHQGEGRSQSSLVPAEHVCRVIDSQP